MEKAIKRFKKGVKKLNKIGVIDSEIARRLEISPSNLWRKLHKAKGLDADFWDSFKILLYENNIDPVTLDPICG